MRLLHLAALAAPLAAFAMPLAAHASTIYSYTGQDYTQASLGYTTSESVTGSFTVASTLAANLSNSTVTPTTFAFNDGVQTITNQTAFSDSFAVSTDSQGNLTGYTITIYNLTSTGSIRLVGGAGALNGDSVKLTTAVNASNQTAGSFRSNAVAAAAVTPEPASLLLVGTAALGFAGTLRRRFRRA